MHLDENTENLNIPSSINDKGFNILLNKVRKEDKKEKRNDEN